MAASTVSTLSVRSTANRFSIIMVARAVASKWSSFAPQRKISGYASSALIGQELAYLIPFNQDVFPILPMMLRHSVIF